MSLQNDGKDVMLTALGAAMLRCSLYDGAGLELEGNGYARQVVSWTLSDHVLELDTLGEDQPCAEFDVPAGTVKYIGFNDAEAANTYIKHDLEEDAEVFTNPGIYQVLAGSVELDPAE